MVKIDMVLTLIDGIVCAHPKSQRARDLLTTMDIPKEVTTIQVHEEIVDFIDRFPDDLIWKIDIAKKNLH